VSNSYHTIRLLLAVILVGTIVREGLSQKEDLEFVVNRIKLNPEIQGITYETSIDGQKRIITYALAPKGAKENDKELQAVYVRVTDARKTELLRLRATKGEVKGRAGDEEFRATADTPAKFEKVDGRAFWLLSQDLVLNGSLGINPVVESVGVDQGVDMSYSSSLSAILTALRLLEILFGEGEGSCRKPNQSTTCVETNLEGTQP